MNVAEDVERVVTAMVAIDESSIERGPLEVVAGSHAEGMVAGKDTDDPFAKNEIDETAYDTSRLVPVPVPAGSVIFFGPLLVHRSAPNKSQKDRRALLYSYQPARNRHVRDALGLIRSD